MDQKPITATFLEPETYTQPNGSSMIIREATLEDLDGIFAIYNYEVLNSIATFDTKPKTKEDALEWFHRFNHKYPIFVAEEVNCNNGTTITENSALHVNNNSSSGGGMIIGWSRLYAYSPRPCYDRTAETAIYVHHEKRGLGIGKILLAKLIQVCPTIGVKVLVGKISDGNGGSVILHEKQGFQTFGVLKRAGEKFGRVIDVIFMSLSLE